jgi:hypothetical protein
VVALVVAEVLDPRGDAVSASIIAATAIATLAVPLWAARTDGAELGGERSGDAAAVETGQARAEEGGDAITGVRRRRGTGGRLRAEGTGDAIARGPGSHANSGVEEVG